MSKRLAAGAQIIGPVISPFWHDGEFDTWEEWRLLLKTARTRYPQTGSPSARAASMAEPGTCGRADRGRVEGVPGVDCRRHAARRVGSQALALAWAVEPNKPLSLRVTIGRAPPRAVLAHRWRVLGHLRARRKLPG
ncbi:divalent cation tolerance protein CutA [Streptomyces sp. NPDC001663]|uniref:divalent cation tolerance protein CutA n=1 Tax=unclassified Streptomyces TaxID=2593676 RepID=UPI00333484D4